MTLEQFVDSQLAHRRAYFSKAEGVEQLRQSPLAFESAVARLARKGRLISPRRGFYLILRPEERALGAPDPARWIDPLMKFCGWTIAYRCCVRLLSTGRHTRRRWFFR